MARREKDREERQQVIAGTSGRDRPTPLPNRPQVAARKSVRAVPNSSDPGERQREGIEVFITMSFVELVYLRTGEHRRREDKRTT